MQRILLIDDDPAVTSLLKRGLSYEGFMVETVQSGAEGLTIARERPSDVVILDVMMPGLNGFEVLQRLRAGDEHLPVLMLTGKDTPWTAPTRADSEEREVLQKHVIYC